MKTKSLFIVAILSLALWACGSSETDKLYGNAWELEYITGPRIAFDGLYPNKKPKISFNKETQKAEGTNSCNGYSAEYTLEGNSISFGEPGPTTMMFCGNGEQTFLKMMQKVNAYSFDDEGKLNLMLDDVTMMRFKKTE